MLNSRRTRRAAAGLATVAAAAGVLVAAGAGTNPANATPGDPGNPSAPVELFHEGFENLSDSQYVTLDSYVRASDGGGYTADAYWLDPAQCNGFVLSYLSTGDLSCGYNGQIRGLARSLGQLNGSASADANHAVAAYSDKLGTTAGAVEFRTVEPLALDVQGRFLSFSVNVAVTNCSAVADPQLQFLLDDGTQELPVTNAAIQPCLSGNGSSQYFSDGSVLFSGSELGIVMRNLEGRSAGNDHAFDDIRVFDATPQLDKAFEPAGQVAGLPSTLTFTVTNTSELAAKAGWSFTDNLPAGLVVAADPNTATDCANGAVTASAGDSSVGFAGDLATGVASCQLSVDVVAADAGTYANGPDNLSDVVGLNPPAEASVTVEPRVEDLVVDKTADVTEAEVGDVITYSFAVTNNGNTDVTDITVNDPMPGLSPVTCDATTLAPGDSTSCSATYTVTDEHHTITNTATVSADQAGGGVVTSEPDSVSVDVLGLCEDGLALLNEPGLDVDRTYVLLSGGIHKGTEDTTRALVDPLTVPLLGLNATDLVHQVNCQIVSPVEDLVDAITVPLIQNLGLQGALRGLFG